MQLNCAYFRILASHACSIGINPYALPSVSIFTSNFYRWTLSLAHRGSSFKIGEKPHPNLKTNFITPQISVCSLSRSFLLKEGHEFLPPSCRWWGVVAVHDTILCCCNNNFHNFQLCENKAFETGWQRIQEPWFWQHIPKHSVFDSSQNPDEMP